MLCMCVCRPPSPGFSCDTWLGLAAGCWKAFIISILMLLCTVVSVGGYGKSPQLCFHAEFKMTWEAQAFAQSCVTISSLVTSPYYSAMIVRHP